MKPRHHLLHVVITIALIAFIFASALPRIRPVARDQIKNEATALVVQAQSVPPSGCDAIAGHHALGSCAPKAQMAFANLQAKIAGDPDDVRSLGPIGIDISNNNGCGFSLASKHPKFVWLKAGESLGFTDRCAAGFVAQAKALRIPFGLYEFAHPSPSSSPRAEAAAFAHRIFLAHGLAALLPPVLDAEYNPYKMSPASLALWECGFVHFAEGYLHRVVDVYTGYWFWTGGNCGSRLWEAAYAPYPIVPAGWRSRFGWAHDVSTWQHSDGKFGPTPRYGVDTDVMLHPERYGLRYVHARLVKAAPPKPKPVPKPPRPAPKPTKRALARAQVEHRHIVAQLRTRHCARHRQRGDCQRLYRHNARLHAEFGKALR